MSSPPSTSFAKLANEPAIASGPTIAPNAQPSSSRAPNHTNSYHFTAPPRSKPPPHSSRSRMENEKRLTQPTSSGGISRQQPTADHSQLSNDSEKVPPRASAGSDFNSTRSSRTVNSPRAHYPPRSSQENQSSLGCIDCGWFTRLPPKFRLWLSFGAWIATSVGFLLAVAFWKTEVFTGLDNLSHWLIAEGWIGYAYMFCLIVLTTIPPLPLYSTLMMLAGYTWGTGTGFLISYTSSLFGAIVVFLFSRHFFGASLVHAVAHAPSFARTVRAVSRNPRLLFLVRLAPYPYNVMNVLLAACPSLTLKRYIGCTGISLLKVVVHTSIGNGIHSFAGYYGVGGHEDQSKSGQEHQDQHSSDLAWWSTIIGAVLCVLLLIYLGHIARRAVDGELEDEDFLENSQSDLLPIHHSQRGRGRSDTRNTRHARVSSTAEERVAFLSPGFGIDENSDDDDLHPGTEMTESNLSAGLIVRSRSPSTG